MTAPTNPKAALHVSDTVITADCRTMTGKQFFDAIFGTRQREQDEAIAAELKAANERRDNRAAADALLKSVALHIGMPFDELKQRTRDQWL